MQPLQREFHGHQIVSSADMRRHEVFKGKEHPQSIGTHDTLAEAIAQAKGKPIPADPPIERVFGDEFKSDGPPLEAVAMDSDGVMKPIDELSEEDVNDG